MEQYCKSIPGKNVLVIGASEKGTALAEEFLSSGAERVVMADSDMERLRLANERLNDLFPGRVRIVISKTDTRERFFWMLNEALSLMDGRIDLLINESGGTMAGTSLTLEREYYAGKTAVVTGAASGIGLALIEELLGCGAEKVVLADYNAKNMEQHAERLSSKFPGRVKGILCNVTVEKDVADMIAAAAEFFGGRIDLLVNNAGAGMAGVFTQPSSSGHAGGGMAALRVQSNEDWEKAFALNFYGALYGCRAVIPIMQKQGGGQVINVISGIAFYPMAYQTMYAATKAALNGLTLSLRTEYWDDNIKFCSATPGTTATAIWPDGKAPETAQTPRQSALRILAGACHNRRVIFGDDADESGSRNCFHPEYGDIVDGYLLKVARERRSGGWVV